MSDSNIEVLKRDTLLTLLENSIGSKVFNSLYVRFKDSGKKTDILNGGEFAGAFFVSSILTLVHLIEKPDATVTKLRRVLEINDKWQMTEDPAEPGDVVFYGDEIFNDSSVGEKVGIVLNLEEVVSIDSDKKIVARHKLHIKPVVLVYRYTW